MNSRRKSIGGADARKVATTVRQFSASARAGRFAGSPPRPRTFESRPMPRGRREPRDLTGRRRAGRPESRPEQACQRGLGLGDVAGVLAGGGQGRQLVAALAETGVVDTALKALEKEELGEVASLAGRVDDERVEA